MVTEVLDEVKDAVRAGASQDEQQRPILAGGSQDTVDLPGWFIDQRQQGWRDFSALPNPTRKDQAWRFSNVDALDLSRYRRGTQCSEPQRGHLLERSVPLNSKSGRLI